MDEHTDTEAVHLWCALYMHIHLKTKISILIEAAVEGQSMIQMLYDIKYKSAKSSNLTNKLHEAGMKNQAYVVNYLTSSVYWVPPFQLQTFAYPFQYCQC